MLPLQKIISSAVLTFIATILYGQEFGGNPSSIKWNQVNTKASRIIFPQGLDSEARHVSNIISYLAENTTNSIGSSQKKINVVLQNQTTISNAYVSLGPFRSEFFLMPMQNSFELGSLPWPDQLTIHEFRHVQQYNNFNVGISKLLRILFGQEGQALGNDAAIPNWFFEGDAVYNETMLSRQGRGRLAYFFKDYRSLWQANKNYSWMKLRNGSYKDFVPDHYALGYLLVAYGREKFGEEFWKNVTHDAAAYKSLFYPFQQAIKKYSGKTFVNFRNDALQYFKNDFTKKTIYTKPGFKTRSEFVNDEYPSFTENGNEIILVKSGYKMLPSFYSIDNNSERKIRTKDVSLDNYFSYRNGNIVYASYRPGIRRGYRDYSEIQVLNAITGKQKRITKNSRYFSPDINKDGSKIVAVEVDKKGNSSLQILNAANGKVITIINNPEQLFYTYPKFYGTDKIISPVRNNKGEMSVAIININNGNNEFIIPFSFAVKGFPTEKNDTIYFSASHKTEDILYAYSVKDKMLFTSQNSFNDEGLGQYQPAISDKDFAWTSFTANGFRLIKKDKTSLQWKVFNEHENESSDFGIDALQKNKINLPDTFSQNNLAVNHYPKSTRLLNFHSIEPNINDPEYSVTLVSENILNTLQSQLSFTYDRNEQFKKFGFDAVYGALFPYLSAGANYTIDRRGRYKGQRVFWNEFEPAAGFNIPLNLSRGRSFTYFNIGSRFTFNHTNYTGLYKDTLGSVSFGYLNNFISFSHQQQKTKQQIYPNFAQTFTLTYKKSVSKFSAGQVVANISLYVPGLFTNHSVVFNGAYLQKNKNSEINFSGNFPFSRGYTSENLYKMTKWGINYHLPLFYPDKGFASIVYVLRARANIFYDETKVNDFFRNGNPFKADFRSTGAEIYFDTKWWNQLPLTVGFRYSYLLDDDLFGGFGKNRWEFILPVNLLQQ